MNQRLYKLIHALLEKDAECLYPQLINSDKKLQLAVWAKEGLTLTPEQRATFMGCTPAESITRARRHMSAEFPMTDEVMAERRARRTKTAMAFRGSRKSSIFERLQIISLKGRGREVVALVKERTDGGQRATA